MRRRRIVVLIALVVASVVGHSPSSRATEIPALIGNHIRAAPGSNHVGDTYPYTLIPNPEYAGSSGWRAYLTISGGASVVYAGYARQARALGLRPVVSGPPCRYRVPGVRTDVACGGVFADVRRELTISIRVCTSCEVPVAAGVLTFLTTPRREVVPRAVQAPVASNRDFALVLDYDIQLRTHATRPWPGEPLGKHAFFTVAENTRVMAASDIEICSGGSFTAVVRGRDSSPEELFEAYRSQLGAHESSVKTAKHPTGRTLVHEARDDFRSVTVVAPYWSPLWPRKFEATALLTACAGA